MFFFIVRWNKGPIFFTAHFLATKMTDCWDNLTAWEALELENTPAEEVINYGQLHPDWITFLTTFGSAKAYRKRVDHFIFWQSLLIDDRDQLARLKDYFFHHHAIKREDGIPLYAPTAFRSWFSIFSKFWLISGRGDLKENISSNKKRTRDDIIYI